MMLPHRCGAWPVTRAISAAIVLASRWRFAGATRSMLAATAMQVLLSTIFGAYSDKRDIQAALKAPAESDFSATGAMWFDFLADTGDGFNPTFTTASLIAADELVLEHDGETIVTERGPLRLLGGDLAYPAATPTQF